MKIKSFDQFVNESVKSTGEFTPKYFDLPYFIPEDRFEGGLLKSNQSRKTSISRKIKNSKPKYQSLEEFFEHTPIDEVEKNILAEINQVVKFIQNNKLTGKEIEANFEQETSLSQYLNSQEEDVLFGTIHTNLPFSSFSIRVDYDIYKNIPVFTFWYDGDLFYYYGIFTLEQNDVLGSGESHTYITASELINYLFYESIWRAAFNELSQMSIDPAEIGFSESKFESFVELSSNPNFPKPIVNNYFNKNFIKVLKNWITTDSPSILTNTKNKFNPDIIPFSGKMSLPGKSGSLYNISMGPSTSTYTVRLLREDSMDDSYIALKFGYNDSGITSIDSGKFSISSGWNSVEWKPLTQDEVHNLYFIDKKGNLVWLKNFINL